MKRTKTQRGWLLLAGGAVLLTGCRHKAVPALTLPPPTPVPVVQPALTATKIPTIPTPKAPLTPVTVPARKVKKPHRKMAAITPVVPPSATPAAPTPAPATLGTLTLGEGGSNAKQAAEASIASLERRVAGLPAELVKEQREQITRVESFAAEAQRALKGGDSYGAQELVMKGKLILDDLLK